MANTSRDVKLTLAVGTTGTESVAQLATDLGGVATAGKAAAPGVERLAAELAALELKTKELRATEAAARADLTLQKQAREDQRDALARYRAESDKAVRSTDEYKRTETELRLAIINGRAAVRDKQSAVESSSAAAKTASAAEQKLAEQIKVATTAADQQVAANKRADDSLRGMGHTANSLGDTLRQLGPIIGAAFTGREFVQTIVSAESLKLGLTAILGSSQAAAAELAFLKKTSNELGLELQSTGQQYLSLTAATKGTTLEGEQTRQVFSAVSRAMSVLGKSSVETERALQAVSQMASKGTVSMEELRGQLGEALPGALKSAADGALITTSQLIKMVENGDVLAKDLLPALAKGLDAIYANGGPPDTLIANWNRFKNTITETSTELGEKGLTRALTDVAIAGTKTAGTIGSGFVAVGEGIGKVAGAVVTLNFKPLIEDLGLAQRSGKEFEEVMYDTVGNVIGVVEKLPPGVQKVATTVEAMGEKGQEAFRKLEIAAQNSANSVIANRQLYTDREEAIKKSLEVAEKAVKASESEAKVLTLVANAFGSETEKRQAATLASQSQEQAQNQLILVKRVELDIATQKLAQLVNETRGIKELDAATKKQKEEMEQSVKVKKEEVRVTEAVGKAHEITTAQLKAAAEAFKDNSTRVYELRAAMVSATEAAAARREEFAKGKATIEQVTVAELAAKTATYLYRDALNDLVTVAKIREQQQAQKGVTQQKENDLNVEAITSTLELAKARNDEGAATKAQEALTRAMVAAKHAAAAALRAEAEATRDTATAEETAAKSTSQLTTEKKAEIEALRESAKQKDLDARKTEILADREEQLAKATNSVTAALERQNAAQERANAALEKSIDLENKRLNRDKEGFSVDPKTGQRINEQIDTQRSVFENAKSQGLSPAEALKISQQFINESGQRVGFGGANFNAGENWGTEVNKAISDVILTNAANSTRVPPSPANSIQPPATVSTVNINMGGRSTSVNVASQSDAQALTSFLRQLESSRGTSA